MNIKKVAFILIWLFVSFLLLFIIPYQVTAGEVTDKLNKRNAESTFRPVTKTRTKGFISAPANNFYDSRYIDLKTRTHGDKSVTTGFVGGQYFHITTQKD